MNSPIALVVFSHLRWNFVYQRPQHLLSRLAEERPVLFIEEPVHDESGRNHWERESPRPNLMVCRPHTASPRIGFHAEQMPALTSLTRQLLEEEGIEDFVLWFYSPLALPIAEGLKPFGHGLRLHG